MLIFFYPFSRWVGVARASDLPPNTRATIEVAFFV